MVELKGAAEHRGGLGQAWSPALTPSPACRAPSWDPSLASLSPPTSNLLTGSWVLVFCLFFFLPPKIHTNCFSVTKIASNSTQREPGSEASWDSSPCLLPPLLPSPAARSLSLGSCFHPALLLCLATFAEGKAPTPESRDGPGSFPSPRQPSVTDEGRAPRLPAVAPMRVRSLPKPLTTGVQASCGGTGFPHYPPGLGSGCRLLHSPAI